MAQPRKRLNKWKFYPATALQLANLVLVAKTVGVERNAIEADVEYLLHHFISKPTHTFEEFDNAWEELHFSHIHFACLKRDYRDRYMNAFFACFLEYFKSDFVPMQCGVIFSLYFLYMSQPSIWGKNRIRVTKEIFSELLKFYVESINTDKNIEAALIFDKLRQMEAFLFVVEQEPNHRYIHEIEEFKNTIQMHEDLRALKIKKIAKDSCTNPDLQEYRRLASRYQSAKREVFYTPQATVATQAMFKKKVHIVENRPRKLQNIILGSSLAKDESDTLDSLNESIRQMINSKKRKLMIERISE